MLKFWKKNIGSWTTLVEQLFACMETNNNIILSVSVPLSYLGQVFYWFKQRWQNDNVIRIPVTFCHSQSSLSFLVIPGYFMSSVILCHCQARRHHCTGIKMWPMFVWWINFYLLFSKSINNDQKLLKVRYENLWFHIYRFN